jgi:c-di-GMP phosphodiesterase
MAPLLSVADYIKIDFMASDSPARRELLGSMKGSGARFVAEKIETEEEFLLAKEEGFHLFQGYFFAKPVVVARPNISSQINTLRLLTELGRPTL